MAVKLGDIVSQAGSDSYRLINGKDVDVTGVSGAHGTLAGADIFLVDAAAAGTQASTLKITASTMSTYFDTSAVAAVAALGTYLTTVDISANTNLVGGTNITLAGDTLNVDDAFLINSGSD